MNSQCYMSGVASLWWPYCTWYLSRLQAFPSHSALSLLSPILSPSSADTTLTIQWKESLLLFEVQGPSSTYPVLSLFTKFLLCHYKDLKCLWPWCSLLEKTQAHAAFIGPNLGACLVMGIFIPPSPSPYLPLPGSPFTVLQPVSIINTNPPSCWLPSLQVLSSMDPLWSLGELVVAVLV